MRAIRADDIARHYDVLERFYERFFGNLNIHHPLWLPGTKSLQDATMNSNQVLARACGLRPGMFVLDAGCGLGGSSFWLAREFGVRVLGISLSESNIRRCRQLVAPQNLEGMVEFAVMDFMGEAFQPDRFDVVWNLESFSYACPKEAYLRSIYRILKPGGMWGCLDGFIDPLRCVKLRDRMDIAWINQGFIHTWEHWEPPSNLQSYLTACGFENFLHEDLTEYILSAPPTGNLRSLIRSVVKLKDLRSNPGLYRMLLASFLASRSALRLMRRGPMTYGLLTARKPAVSAT